MTKSRKHGKDESGTDVIIVGGGPAGMSALLWAHKLGLSALLVEREADLGGQLHSIFNPITDYPGRATRGGAEMLRCFKKSLGDVERSILTRTTVERIDVDKRELTLGSGRSIIAKSIILAMGVRRRRLNVPGESEFSGKGILTSGAKQQRSVRGKRVAIIGGGDAAFENALILSEVSDHVCLIHRRSEFSARHEFVARVRASSKVELITDSSVTSINGDRRLRSISLRGTKDLAIRELDIDALLIRIGVEPNSELVRDKLKLDRSGYIVVDPQCQTNKPNVFAIGDIANPVSPTLATSVGTGAIAANSIAETLLGRGSGVNKLSAKL